MRRARELAGMDRASAAHAVGIGRRDLRAIERDRRPADGEVLERVLQAYGGTGLDLPPRQDLVRANEPGVLVIGDERVQVDPFRSSDEPVLVDYVAAVRRQRGLGESDVVRFRSNDLVQLAAVLDLGSDRLEAQLQRIAGLERDPAVRAARTLVLTGLAMALAGTTLTPEAPTTWIPTPAVTGRPLFDVGAPEPHPEDASAADAASDALAPAGPSPFGVGSRERVAVQDSSWLASDGRRSTFTTVPRVRLDAIAELVAQVEPSAGPVPSTALVDGSAHEVPALPSVSGPD